MQVKAGQNIHLGDIDDVEEPIREASQHRAPHVAIHALIERRICLEMTFDARCLCAS